MFVGVAQLAAILPGVGGEFIELGLDFGALLSAIIYFLVFMAVVYFVIVVPYKAIQARRGTTVFGEPAPVKTCPACLSSDLPAAASKCKYCGTDQPQTATA